MSVFSISEATTLIKLHLENEPILRDLSIRGEVSNATASAAGHVYFTLKDSASQIRCVMFRPQRNRHLVETGVSLIAHGSISVYEARGDLQFYVREVVPDGSGTISEELEALRNALEKEGVFEPTRKRVLPKFPLIIGLITSTQGAVLHDIQNVLRRRYPLVTLRVAPTAVQGTAAVSGILEGIRNLNTEGKVDLIILARGGGSSEDLEAFNDEAVVRAIHGSKIPIVTGIGHDTDTTLSDLAADVHAPTPSAAAELSVPNSDDLFHQVLDNHTGLGTQFRNFLFQRSQSIHSARAKLDSATPDFARAYQRIDDAVANSARVLTTQYALHSEALRSLKARLATLNPNDVLRRGYSVLTVENTGQIVTSHRQVDKGISLTSATPDGFIHSIVTGVSDNPEELGANHGD